MLTAPAPVKSSTYAEPADSLYIDADERRGSMRIHRRLETRLSGHGCSNGHCCLATDISEGGLHVQVPLSAGITVGQRFEVALADHSQAPDLAPLFSGGCFGTVVRTERVVDTAVSSIGIGLRFDQPLML